MGIAELSEAIEEVAGIIARHDEPLRAHTPLRVGGPADLWVEVRTLDALQAFTAEARAAGTRWRINWPFADWLVRDGGLSGVVLRLGGEFEQIHIDDAAITLGSAALWSALPNSLKGGLWDAMRAWPGSVGDVLHSDTSAQLSELVTGIRVMRGGRVIELEWPSGAPVPRVGESSVLVSVVMRRAAASRRWLAAPPKPGTLFHDVDDAVVGAELKRAGVLGTRLRSWRLSTVEPGTIVHLGTGSFSDLAMLIKGVKVRVEKTRGLSLEPRIPILGSNQKPQPRHSPIESRLRD
tara:strand:- start:2270 stop:3148 length:879 start_codon:yes stop_codon:yes gene_type:complete